MNNLFEMLTRDLGFATPIAKDAAVTFLRVGAAVGLLPGLGEQALPPRIRLGLALLLTLAVLPATAPAVRQLSLSDALIPETLIGVILGLALRFFIFALSTAGAIIANSTSLSQLFAPGREPQPAISQFLVMAGVALALSNDLMPKLVGYLLSSYDTFPAGAVPAAADLAEWAVHHADTTFALGFKIALPFAVASLLYNLALGVINRAMPQLMVTFIGAPALSLGGLALLAVSAPVVLRVWYQAFAEFIAGSGGL